MGSIVSVLTPNIKTAEEYKCTLRKLSEIGIDHIEHDYDISMDEWEVNVNATMEDGSTCSQRRRCTIFLVRVSVFPAPAPAMIRR